MRFRRTKGKSGQIVCHNDPMKQQVVLINGGTTFDSYSDYLTDLKTKKLSLERIMTFKDWKMTLQEDLGENFIVLSPRMPNTANAQYGEWKIMFEKTLALLSGRPILIGHSLGGIFLAKYLSENKINNKIKAVFLLAAPFDEEDDGESLASFSLPKSLELFAKQVDKIFLLQSEDDPVVFFNQVKKYERALPDAQLITFDDRGHFLVEKMPELVNLIKGLV